MPPRAGDERRVARKRAGARGISEASVRAATGKSSRAWYGILDRWGAKKKGHTASARYLHQAFGVTPWWSQTLTIRYEYERGLRRTRVTIPADLRRALARSTRAKAWFDQMPPSHKREYIKWVEEARRPETRARRVRQALARIREGAPEPRP